MTQTSHILLTIKSLCFRVFGAGEVGTAAFGPVMGEVHPASAGGYPLPCDFASDDGGGSRQETPFENRVVFTPS
jgi:hypothetical protein